MGRIGQGQQVLAEALSVARQVSYVDGGAAAIAAVAGALITAKLTDQGKEVADEALVAASVSANNDDYYLFDQVAATLAKTGNEDSAVSAAKRIRDDRRFSALIAIAKGLAEVGKTERVNRALDDALAALRSMNSRSYVAYQDTLCELLCRVDRGDDALNIANGLATSLERDSALVSIAQASSNSDRPMEALRALTDLKNRTWETKTVRAVALAFARIGQADEAFRIFSRIDELDSSLCDIRIEVSNALFDAGRMDSANQELDEAIMCARALPWRRGQLLAKAAEALRRFDRKGEADGLLAEALAAARRSKDDDDSSISLASVAKSFGRLGFYRQARLTADECSVSRDQVDAYATLLTEYSKRKNSVLRMRLDSEQKSTPEPE